MRIISASRASPRRAALIVELEGDSDVARYIAFDAPGLRAYAGALRRCLRLLDVHRGDTLAFFDFGTSPVVYLSASSYVPGLTRGAAESLGCTTICNDGVATMSERAVTILRYVRPRFFFVRADLLGPFTAACDRAQLDIANYTEALIVTRNGSIPQWQLALRSVVTPRMTVYQMPRMDDALFFAIECPSCTALHTWRDLYEIDLVDPRTHRPVAREGLIRVRERFAGKVSRRVVTNLRGRLLDGRCYRGPRDLRFSV